MTAYVEISIPFAPDTYIMATVDGEGVWSVDPDSLTHFANPLTERRSWERQLTALASAPTQHFAYEPNPAMRYAQAAIENLAPAVQGVKVVKSVLTPDPDLPGDAVY